MEMASAASGKEMDMGGGSCKLTMLLNWHTIDTCFLSSTFHIHSSGGFFLACLCSFLLVVSLEFLRRLQRKYDRYLVSKHAFLDGRWQEVDDMTQELLPMKAQNNTQDTSSRTMRRILMPSMVVVLEQLARGGIHMVQFTASYCVMLLVMYSNGYIILSIVLGAFVGFSLFTRDMLASKGGNYPQGKQEPKGCC